MAAPPLSILFDLDGTVVDSKPGILASCRAALSSLGHRPGSLEIGNLIGPPLEEVCVHAGLEQRPRRSRAAVITLPRRPAPAVPPDQRPAPSVAAYDELLRNPPSAGGTR